MAVAESFSRSQWFILLLSFLTLFGPYYCYDLPAANINAVRTPLYPEIAAVFRMPELSLC